MKYFLGILLAIVVFGCATRQNITDVKWDKKEIVKHWFDLISNNEIQQLFFTEDGNVLATIGTKEMGVCAPVLSWHIDEIGILIINDDSIQITLQKVSSDGKTIQVLKNGKPAKYKTRKDE